MSRRSCVKNLAGEGWWPLTRVDFVVVERLCALEWLADDIDPSVRGLAHERACGDRRVWKIRLYCTAGIGIHRRGFEALLDGHLVREPFACQKATVVDVDVALAHLRQLACQLTSGKEIFICGPVEHAKVIALAESLEQRGHRAAGRLGHAVVDEPSPMCDMVGRRWRRAGNVGSRRDSHYEEHPH